MVRTVTPVQPFEAYADLSPNGGTALTRGKPSADWFMSGTAEAYIQQLLARFEERHPEAAAELAAIASEGKWSTGWKGFGRMLLEVLG